MKLNDGYQYIILCEDKQTESFIRAVLIDQNIPRRKIRVCPYSAGVGSGEQRVRRSFPGELRYLRSKAYNRIVLIVSTDADKLSVEQRKRTLFEELLSADPKTQLPGKDEPLMIWIPKRNIETWICFWRGVPGIADRVG